MSKLARIAEKELRLARDWKQKRWISMKQKHETLERYWENEKCWRPPRWKWGQWKRANTNTYDISSIKHITRKLHIAVVSQLFFFCYLDLLIFLPLTHCRCHSALHNNYFIFCLNIYYNYINKSFTFSPGYIYLVYTKTVDSVFRTLWLATQSVNILHYSLIHLQFLQVSDMKLM